MWAAASTATAPYWAGSASPWSRGRSATEHRLKSVEDRRLAPQDLRPRLGGSEPARLVDLGERAEAAALRGIFDREMVAGQRRRVEIAFQGEGLHPFAACLPDRAQRPRLAFRFRPQLLFELAQRGGQRRLVRLDHALRDHPRPVILAAPEGPARMDEEQAQAVRIAAVEQDSGASGDHQEASGTRTRWMVPSGEDWTSLLALRRWRKTVTSRLPRPGLAAPAMKPLPSSATSMKAAPSSRQAFTRIEPPPSPKACLQALVTSSLTMIPIATALSCGTRIGSNSTASAIPSGMMPRRIWPHISWSWSWSRTLASPWLLGASAS